MDLCEICAWNIFIYEIEISKIEQINSFNGEMTFWMDHFHFTEYKYNIENRIDKSVSIEYWSDSWGCDNWIHWRPLEL